MFSFYFLLLASVVVIMPAISSAAADTSPPYSPADNILLNCGETSKSTSADGREWDIDSQPKYIPSSDILNTSTSTSKTPQQSPSVDQTPYSTARIFHSKFTYKIPVSGAGQKFLRLYFYPTNYSNGFEKISSLFSVDAANHNLLSNFRAFLNLQPTSFTLVKEYIITVNKSCVLEVTFTPSINSYAFVNGIEVVSIPNKLYIQEEHAIPVVDLKPLFVIDDSMAFEKLYRLNVGGNGINSKDDTGMFRSWDEDEPYLFRDFLGFTPQLEVSINYTLDTPPYTAPDIVYSTARTLQTKSEDSNLTWSFQVDSGFTYLLRLYFCEFMPAVVTRTNQRVFSIFINNRTAEQKADVIGWTGGEGIPVYKDFVVLVAYTPGDSKPKPNLWLAMHPNMETKPEIGNTILNGLELFKISQGSLAEPNSDIVRSPPSETKKSRGSKKSLPIVASSFGGILFFSFIIGFLLFRRRTNKSNIIRTKSMWYPLWFHRSRSTNTNKSLLPTVRSLKFSVEEIKLATSNFDGNFVIGTGGFGNVYKGNVENGTYPVAIKRSNPSSRQGIHEFQTEIKILSNLRHIHLVPLIGYCDDSGEMILVYDYMVNGTLRSHLYGGNNPPMSWKQRLQICLGAARGLHYLHASAERVIIHRDVKSTNILLDERMVAKVSDFGLSKMSPNDTGITHFSTIVKGSFGYLDPEYYMRQQLTCKSDVYSFGVVLFEVLCARPVIIQELPHEQVNLAEWSRNCYRKGRLCEIVDKDLSGRISVESLKKFGEVGYSCLSNQGTDRPTMGDVVSSLEHALQLQESYEKLDHKINPNLEDQTDHLPSEARDHNDLMSPKIVVKAKSPESSTKSDSEGFKSGIGSVFSEILNPNAR